MNQPDDKLIFAQIVSGSRKKYLFWIILVVYNKNISIRSLDTAIEEYDPHTRMILTKEKSTGKCFFESPSHINSKTHEIYENYFFPLDRPEGLGQLTNVSLILSFFSIQSRKH